MGKILLLLALLFPIGSNAANWDLFPLNQKSYFLAHEYYQEYIVMVSCDSSYNLAGSTVLVNMKKINTEQSNGCYDGSYFDYSHNIIDTISHSGDTAFYVYQYYNDSMYFLPKANPGDSWTIDGYTQITFTCVSVTLDSVLGVLDSVKTFSLQEAVVSNPPLSQNVVRLSKNFGLIEFVKFDEFFYHSSGYDFTVYELAGFADSVQSAGFSQPLYSDYFPYNVGDVLMWNMHFDNGGNWMNPNYDDYYRDSITSLTANSDSLVYIYDEWYLSHVTNQVTFSSGLQNVIYYKYPGPLLTSPPFTNVLSDLLAGGSGMKTSWKSLEMYSVLDTVLGNREIERKFETYGDQLDTLSCYLYWTSDYAYYLTYNTYLGLVEKCEFWNSSSFCHRLTSASINGVVYSNLNLPVGISSIPDVLVLESFPVPATDFVFFKSDAEGEASVKIFNCLGAEIMSIENFNSKEPVYLSSLPSGIYYATIQIQGKKFHSRIVKV